MKEINSEDQVTIDEVTRTRASKLRDSSHIFSINKKISKETAMRLQRELGYHPAGYGFYRFTSSNGKSTWRCSASCD